MAVIMKTKNYALFQKVGVSQTLIEQMEAANIKLGIGFFDLMFYSPVTGDQVAHAKLSKSTNDLMKGAVSGTALSAIKSVIEHSIKHAVTTVAGAVSVPVEEAVSAPVEPPAPPVQPVESVEDILKKEVVPLKEASTLYQPVKGTSSSSRYFVVAMNDQVKVAARVHGDELSVRVEGNLTKEVVSAFAGVAVTKKDGYLSGHFSLEGKVTHDRLLGSILLGSGLAFNTQMPQVKILKGVH